MCKQAIWIVCALVAVGVMAGCGQSAADREAAMKRAVELSAGITALGIEDVTVGAGAEAAPGRGTLMDGTKVDSSRSQRAVSVRARRRRGDPWLGRRPQGQLVAALVVVALGTLPVTGADVMGLLAERYVRLVLAVGQHDADFVDAYYGPPAWKPDAGQDPRSTSDLERVANRLIQDLEATPLPAAALDRLRRDYLIAQTRATLTRLHMLRGSRLTFDEESRALYGAVAPTHDEAYLDEALKALDGLVPGDGPLAPRVEAFRQRFVVPPGKLDAVFRAAVERRQQTAAHITLPPARASPSSTSPTSRGAATTGTKADYRSVIQVNTDLPIFIDRAIDLACHEGYPGHHVYNLLLERELVRKRGWRSSPSTRSSSAVAHRGGQRQLRHRDGVPRVRNGWPTSGNGCFRWRGSTRQGGALLPGDGAADLAAWLRGQRSRATLSRWPVDSLAAAEPG